MENAAGSSPKIAVKAVIMMGRKRSREPCDDAPRPAICLPIAQRWNEDTCKMASMTATPKMEMKPTAAETLKLVCVRQQRPHAAAAQGHDVGEHDQHVDQGTERHVQQHGHQGRRPRG